MRVWLRYAAFQLPEGVIVALALWGLHSFLGWPTPVVWGLLVAWIVKEIVLYPFVKRAYDNSPSRHVGAEHMLGATGIADEDLDPEGYVRVRGELWRAELLGRGPVIRGAAVAVHAVRDLTLLVRPDEG